MKCLIVFSIGIVCLLITYLFKKTLYNASGIFVLMWSVCLGLSCLGLYGLNKPSNEVIYLGCLSMLIFTFTGILKTKLIIFDKKSIKNSTFLKYDPLTDNSKLFLFHIIAYIFSFPYLLKAIKIIKNVGMYALRNVAFTNSEYASTSVLIIFQTIIAPLFVVTMLLTMIDISRGFFFKKSIFLTFVDVILYTILFGGRYMFFQLLIFLIFVMYDGYGGRLIYFINKHKKIVLFSLIIVLIMIFITQSRSKRAFLESAYVYYCGSFSYLSYLINNKIGTDLYLLGKTQIGFVYNFCFLIISFLTNIDYKGSNHIVTQLTQFTVSIGDGISYNSLGTILHDFITDYGIYGSLFGIFLFGIACKYFEDAKNNTGRSFYYASNIYFLYSTVNSVLSYTFRGPGTLMLFIYLFMFCKGKK